MSTQVHTPASVEPDETTEETVITPVSGWSLPNLKELRHSLDLVYFLAKRDVTVRYKQTAVGALWAVLQPLLLAVVFSVFLGRVSHLPSEHVPYALFALTGMTMWLFFATAISRCSDSTISSAELISKVYFPRLAIPIAAMMPPIMDFAASFAVLLAVLLVFGQVPGIQILLVPVVFAVALALALGIGFWLSATIVRYRDISNVVTFMTTLLLFITPVLYPLSLISKAYQPLYALNPLVGVLETFRWAVLPDASPPGLLLLIPATTGIALILTGLLYFERAERRFADVI
ncbi:MAG TPA: ABC transporter permease [Thermoleophilaceae bacterium]|nr:ABC transporter permease [Thermoleophilaceae bacterium]